METITQTNRTILFAEINPERLNLLTLVGDVRGKSSLDDDKIKEINEELLVSSFEEFLEKVYSGGIFLVRRSHRNHSVQSDKAGKYSPELYHGNTAE